MVAPLYGLALIFQDLGLGHATVQSAEVTPAQSNALFWLNVAVSLCLAVPLIFGAPMVGWFYGDDRVVGLTRGFAAMIVIGALGAQHSALLNRSMRFRFLAALDTIFRACRVSGAVLLAAVFHTYWALFAAYAISATVSVIGAWIGTGFRAGLPRWESSAQQMVRLGAGITGFNFFTFIARNLDNVLIGRVWGDAALGLYDRAYKFLLFPLLQINAPLARVMLPALARLRTDEARYRSVYLRAVNQLLLVTQPGIVFAIATADIFFRYYSGRNGARPRRYSSGWARGVGAAHQRGHELAVHQSRARQGLRLVWGIQCGDQRRRVLRRFAVGADWRGGGLLHFASVLAVARRVVDGDANRAGATARLLRHSDDARARERGLLHSDRCRTPRAPARWYSRSRVPPVPLLRAHGAGGGADTIRPDGAAGKPFRAHAPCIPIGSGTGGRRWLILRCLRQCWVKARVVAPPQPSGDRFTFAVLRAGMNKICINSRRLDQDCNRPPVKARMPTKPTSTIRVDNRNASAAGDPKLR